MRCNFISSFAFFFFLFSHLLDPSWSWLALTGLLGPPLYSYRNIHTYICIHMCVCTRTYLFLSWSCCCSRTRVSNSPLFWGERSSLRTMDIAPEIFVCTLKFFVPEVVPSYHHYLWHVNICNSLIPPCPAKSPMEWYFRAWSSSFSQPGLYQVSPFKNLSPELWIFRVSRHTFLRFSEELPSNAATQIKGNSGVIQISLLKIDPVFRFFNAFQHYLLWHDTTCQGKIFSVSWDMHYLQRTLHLPGICLFWHFKASR